MGYLTATAAGTTNWTCPTDVTRLGVFIHGAGGGGGGGAASAGNGGSGGGGGGSVGHIATGLTPTTVYPFSVGTKGTAGTGGSGDGGLGGDTTFNTSTVVAKGGAGGKYNRGGGGAGGLASAGTGDHKYNGGTGGVGSTTAGWSGGASGGIGAAGTNGTAAAAAAAVPGGGPGGAGSSSTTGSAPASGPGGGGGGGDDSSKAGGTGYDGRAIYGWMEDGKWVGSLTDGAGDGDATFDIDSLGWSEGDLAIVMSCWYGTTMPTLVDTPGWESLSYNDALTRRFTMFWRNLRGKNPNTFTAPNATDHNACMVVVRGFCGVDQYSNTAYVTNNTCIRGASITPTVNDSLIAVCGGGLYGSPITGFQVAGVPYHVYSNNATTTRARIGVVTQGTAAATGVFDGPLSTASTTKHCFVMNFKPLSFVRPGYRHPGAGSSKMWQD